MQTIRGRFESSAYKRVIESRDTALVSKDQKLRSKGSRRGGGKSRGRNGGQEEGEKDGGTGSGSETTEQKERCFVCEEMVTHRARNCPKRISYRCGETGHFMFECPRSSEKTEDASLAIGEVEDSSEERPVASGVEPL